MDAKQLLDLVQRYHENREFIGNEETAKVALVIPFIKLLGYDPSMPREVRLEYSADFTVGDGKRLPDRMDFAIFDRTGAKPLMVIETKPLGTDLLSKSQQLARYLAQMKDLHFGIITDGCHYYFFGDLESPNQMDGEPFFTFSLDDTKTDWTKVANFLGKFSRESFNAETLITDAENSRYRQGMIDRLVKALRAPADDEAFLRWLTEDVYKGKRTAAVMTRLGDVAREAVEPALLRVMGDDFVEKLKQRIQKLNESGSPDGKETNTVRDVPTNLQPVTKPQPTDEAQKPPANGVETTAEELEFFETVSGICVKAGYERAEILHRDTVNYFNVSYRRPTKWFVRYFSGGRRRNIVTLVPVEEAKQLCPGFEVEESPATFGISRVNIDSVAQLWALSALVTRSLQLLQASKDEGDATTVASTPTV